MGSITEILEFLSLLSTSVGIPVWVFLFLREKRKERQEREYGTYNALDEKYVEFQKLCLEYPNLDIFDSQELNRQDYTPQEERQELIIFTILVSLLERAFLMYQEQSDDIKQCQWEGWDLEIENWCKRARFIHAWQIIGENYDTTFTEYILGKFKTSAIELTSDKQNLDSDV